MRALVVVVVHAVAVVVTHGLVAERPGELRDTRDERVGHVAVAMPGAILALVVEHEVLAAVHFLAHAVAGIRQVAYADVETAGKLDVAEEVEEEHLEVETGRQEHRVDQRVDRIVVAADAHFAAEFQERLEVFVQDPVHAGAVHERVGTVAEHRHETDAGVPPNRDADLGVVKLDDAGKAGHHAVRGVGVGRAVAVAVQEPGMAGAHAHVLPAGRQPQVEHHGRTHVVRTEVVRRAPLAVELEVAQATLDHARGGSLAGVVLGVVIVDGQTDTQVQVLAETEGEVEVTREGAVDTAFAHVGVPLVELLPVALGIHEPAATSIAELVGGDSTAGTGTEVPGAERIRVLLMQTCPSPEKTCLSEQTHLQEKQDK